MFRQVVDVGTNYSQMAILGPLQGWDSRRLDRFWVLWLEDSFFFPVFFFFGGGGGVQKTDLI